MTVWVKEFADYLTTNDVLMLTQADILVRPFVSTDCIEPPDVIVISGHDSVSETDFSPFTVLVYEVFFEKMSQNAISEYLYNHDYYYLKNALTYAMTPHISTIITGSSYGLFGIDETMLTKEVNLSLMSQDLFYSLKGIYEVCRVNKHIKNIVLCCGYYYFYSDLSKTQNQKELSRVAKVYEPLFNDIHNCICLPPPNNILQHSRIFDFQHITDLYSAGEYEKHYFHSGRPRKNFATREWEDKAKLWTQLSETERQAAGERRATAHNRNQKRTLSLIENTARLQELTSFCTKNNIQLLVVVTPASKYYRDALWSGYKDSFYDTLNSAEGMIHLLDLYDNDSFYNEDFNDTDHLSDSGAQKMTAMILDMLG